jgi:hypothetical protein
MIEGRPVFRGPGRSNMRGAIITLILEAAVVATLGLVGAGMSLLVLWLSG